MAFRAHPKRTIYDGRGAIEAEWMEYDVVKSKSLLSQVHKLENEAINSSIFRLAVSQKLVDYWVSQFNYRKLDHVVIPCTLNESFENIELNMNSISNVRLELGLEGDDIVFLYSGSTAGWQSFKLLHDFIQPILLASMRNKIVFFCDLDENIELLQSEFGQRVINRKLQSSEVSKHLLAGDYGLLIREESVTNQVASPVKFAEYLASGLFVIISENLGDYSEFVKDKKCGYLSNEHKHLVKPELDDKIRIKKLANDYFTKANYMQQYSQLIGFCEKEEHSVDS
ncbi:MAG: hypothetical protein PSX36_09215 [bacterium]|nr:hypothetical protein [bacterium]